MALQRNDKVLFAAFGVAAAVAVVAPALLADYGIITKQSEVIAEWTTAAATVGLVALASVQLRALVKTSNADFIHKLNGDFFTPESRVLRKLLDDPALTFRAEADKGQFLLAGEIKFTDHDLDDLVLGPLESIGIFHKAGAIDLTETYEMFGWYALRVWEKEVVQQYVRWLRARDDGADLYDHLQKLHDECEAYHRAKIQRIRS